MSSHLELTSLRSRGIASLALSCLFAGMLVRPAVAQDKAAKPAPDVIVFSNGDQLSGTLERAVGNSVVFKSDAIGEITVSLDKIKELHSNGSFAVLKKSDKITKTPHIPGSISYSNDIVTLTEPNGANEAVPSKDLAFIVDKATYEKEVTGKPGIWYGWNGSVTGGITLIRATQNGSNYTAAMSLIRQVPTAAYLPPRNRTTFNLLETYGKLTQPVIPQTTPPTPVAIAKTSIFHADAEHDRYFSPRFYGLVDASFDHNFSLGLDFQQIYGVGVGWTPILDAIQELDLKADVHYEKQNFIQLPPPNLSTPSQNLIGSTISENYHRTLPAKIIFTESASILPAFNNSNAYSAVAAAGFTLPTYKRLSIALNGTDNYLNNPTPGYKKNSFQFVTGVTYTLH
jgi:hypothetical protein